MPVDQLQRVFQTACRVAQVYAVEDSADAELVEDFLARKDDTAFAELVRRHGPMVLGVCRRVIGSHHEAEDAFQATFLVLVRKAASLGSQDHIAGWLHGVAYRTALEARGRRTRQLPREMPMDDFPDRSDETVMRNEIKTILDREVSRLPDKYRLPVVLCELEGRSRSEAARLLSLTEGTLSSRLATARKALAKRLSKYGLTLPPVGLLVVSEQASVACAVPQQLAESTVSSAVQSLSGQALNAVPASVLSLTDAVVRAMSLSKAKLVMAFVLVAGAIATSAVIGLSPEATIVHAAVVKAEPTPPELHDPTEPEKQEVKTVTPEAAPKGAAQVQPPDLKKRLKQFESDIVRIRQAMLKECDAEEKRADEAIRKAKNDMDEALRRRDFDGQKRAVQAMTKANNDKATAHRMRSDVEVRLRLEDAKTPFEQQLGLSMSSPNNVIAKIAHFPKERERGLMIERVTKDSIAANAGFQPFDIVIEIDGHSASNLAEFRRLLADSDGSVDFTLLRKGKRETLKNVTLPAPRD